MGTWTTTGREKGRILYSVYVYIIQQKERKRINNMSENHLHIPASLFLLLSRGSITFAAVDIHGRTWQVASGVDDDMDNDGKRKREDTVYLYCLHYPTKVKKKD